MSSPAQVFNLTGPLPHGLNVLEASAGTGKTYTIANLTLRYVAEAGIPIDRIMVATFTTNASHELAERIWVRLNDAQLQLAGRQEPAPNDEVMAGLLSGTPEQRHERLNRIRRALADFETATIGTIHRFCNHVAALLGMELPAVGASSRFAVDLRSVAQAVARDLVLTQGAMPGPSMGEKDLGSLVHEVAASATTRILPPITGGEAPDSDRAIGQFGASLRVGIAQRKSALGIRTYDDQILDVARALQGESQGQAARQLVASRYDVALVDEFQDTDATQYAIVKACFAQQTLILIGDPKQAIYGFRGGDVSTYQQAAKDPEVTRWRLATNWRSDRTLVDVVSGMFASANLGRGITLQPVDSRHEDRYTATNDARPLQLRVMPEPGSNDKPKAAAVREHIVVDTVAELNKLLCSGVQLIDSDSGQSRPLQASDIAVLTRTGLQAQEIHQALGQAGIPAVFAGGSSVLATQAASDWQLLLEAMSDPSDAVALRRLAMSRFVGLSAAVLAADPEAAVTRAARVAMAARRAWDERGVSAILPVVDAETGWEQELLSRPGGERLLTDFRHLSQLLTTAVVSEHRGLTGLLDILNSGLEDSEDADALTSRRLETEQNAVTVMTVHKSKGLEFGVVLVPFGAFPARFRLDREYRPRTLHDQQGRRSVYLGMSPSSAVTQWSDSEDMAEEIRLLYVAMTRAKHQVIAWWAHHSTSFQGPLSTLLFNGDEPSGSEAVSMLQERFDPQQASVRLVDRDAAVNVTAISDSSSTVESGTLQVADFDRILDTSWRRYSFSSLTAAVHDAQQVAATSEPSIDLRADEFDVPDPTEEEDPATIGGGFDAEQAAGVASPMAELPMGAHFGTLVHELFELVDLSAADADEQLSAHLEYALSDQSFPELTAEQLAQAITPSTNTPLGPLARGMTLRQIRRSDLLAELDFELPFADAEEQSVRLQQVVDLLREFGRNDPFLAQYAQALADSGVVDRVVSGFLNGSIDALIRVHDPESETDRFIVADYKTNWLGPWGSDGRAPLLVDHYNQSAMEQAMIVAHYPLQAMLYAVAVHRYLSWRLPNYDPQVNLGGVLYLFLRGMAGPEVMTTEPGLGTGVFSWQPAPALIVALSNVFAGGGLS